MPTARISLILLCLLWAAPAFAQPRPPHSLGEEITPAQDIPGASEDGSFEGDTPAPAIHEMPIAQPSIDGFGTLLAGRGGLQADIWKGSTRQDAASLLEQFRSGVANPELRDLLTRLLMTQATPPAGDGPNWFLVRINALIALGLDEKADAMIASLPASMTSDGLRQMRAQLLLVRGEADNACKLAPNLQDPHAAPQATGLFWRKLAILCQTRAGKKDEAMVGLDMLREESPHDDAFFQEAVRRIGDKAAQVKSLPREWSLMDAALLHMTGDTMLIKAHVDALPPVAIKYLAQDPSLDAKLREKATARAIQLGVLPQNPANKIPEQPFERALASDIVTLVRALGSGRAAGSGDNAIIARLDVGETAGTQDCRRVQKLLSLMEPFGYVVPPAVWQKLFAHRSRYDGEVPPATLIERLHDAAQLGRRGEVIVLAALITDAQDTSHMSELALVPVVRALKTAGFEKDARQIAYGAVKDYK